MIMHGIISFMIGTEKKGYKKTTEKGTTMDPLEKENESKKNCNEKNAMTFIRGVNEYFFKKKLPKMNQTSI